MSSRFFAKYSSSEDEDENVSSASYTSDSDGYSSSDDDHSENEQPSQQANESTMKAANKYLSAAGKYNAGNVKTGSHSRYIDSDEEEDDEDAGRSGADRWKKREPKATAATTEAKPEIKKKMNVKKEEHEEEAMDEKTFLRQRLESQWGEITETDILACLKQVMSARGKKTTSRSDQLAYIGLLFEELKGNSGRPDLEFRVRCGLMTCQFDSLLAVSSNANQSTLPLWREIESNLSELWKLRETFGIQGLKLKTTEDRLFRFDSVAVETDSEMENYIMSSLSIPVHKLDEEWAKSIQVLTDLGQGGNPEYLERMADEKKIIHHLNNLAKKANNPEEKKIFTLRLLDHLYDKSEPILNAHGFTGAEVSDMASNLLMDYTELLETFNGKLKAKSEVEKAKNKDRSEADLEKSVLTDKGLASEGLLFRAAVYWIYQESLRLQYPVAKGLLQKYSKLLVPATGPQTVLYNRVLIRVALSAFLTGYLEDCYLILHEFYTLCGTNYNTIALIQKQREHIGQSHHTLVEEDFSQESAAVSPFMNSLRLSSPWHSHYSLELLEVIYLMAVLGHTTHAKQLMSTSKYLRKFVEIYEKQTSWRGPPETTKDHVYQALSPFIQLASGANSTSAYTTLNAAPILDWRAIVAMLSKIKAWKYLSNQNVLPAILALYVKRLCLMYYLTFDGKYLESITLTYLTNAFDLSEEEVLQVLDTVYPEGPLPYQLTETGVIKYKMVTQDTSLEQFRESLETILTSAFNVEHQIAYLEQQLNYLSSGSPTTNTSGNMIQQMAQLNLDVSSGNKKYSNIGKKYQGQQGGGYQGQGPQSGGYHYGYSKAQASNSVLPTALKLKF